ncbi:hypothetical protein GO986_18000 [Deinococcus sp. HMF7620]|uniref:Uncharacterized protein n=1 Tax=Deinococcus arboris TaxID=2682977 RepID=A0A7C9HTL5_9DEIO|nr:hypothetical protein [Deinococcus arboris]MVN88632.1 hypothetical protein [Deinococcus arboris]
MSDRVKVTALGQTYRHRGEAFGPFVATPEQPFTEVPAAIQLVSGAPVYDEAQAPAEPGVDIQELLDANAGLKADLDTAQREGSEAQRRFEHEQAQHEKTREGYAEFSNQYETKKAAWETDRAALVEQIDQGAEQLRALEVQLAEAQNTAQVAPAPLTLPEGLRDQIAGLKGVSVRQADEIMDLFRAALGIVPTGDASA